MDDLHERMEHLARRVDTAAAPDLERVRQRHTRRRRTSALAVGVALALIVALLAVQMIRPSAPGLPAASQGPSSDTVTVWPDADTGAEPWRADPTQLIRRFAQTVLGWSDPFILAEDGENTFEMRPEECPDNARCTPSLTISTVETRPGVWSVQAITQPDLRIEVDVAEPVVVASGGSGIRFDLNLADARAGHIGMVASNGCREATAFEVGLDAGSHVLELPEVTSDDPGCDDLGTGYLFAYAMDDTTVPTGDPLLESAAIEYPWLTVIPIYLQMEEPDATSTATPVGSDLFETLGVSCDGDVATLEGTRVASGPMGVAFSVTTSAPDTKVLIGHQTGQDRVTGRGSSVLDVPPGHHTISCRPDGQIAGTVASFEVVDTGYWTPFTALDCGQTVGSTGGYGGPTPVVDQHDLAFSAYEAVFPAADADVRMVPQGYPEDPTQRVYAAVRPDGETIARVILQTIEEGWGVAGMLVCA